MFWVTGRVYPEVEKKLPHYPHRTPRVVFRNLGGGANSRNSRRGRTWNRGKLTSSRGCAVGDFDNDGDLDILIVNINEPPSLLRNDVNRRQSLAQGVAAMATGRTAAPSARCVGPIRRQETNAGGTGASRLFVK